MGPAVTSVGKYFSVSLIKQPQDLDGTHGVGVKGLMRKYVDVNLPAGRGVEVEESTEEVHTGEGSGSAGVWERVVGGAGICDGGGVCDGGGGL